MKINKRCRFKTPMNPKTFAGGRGLKPDPATDAWAVDYCKRHFIPWALSGRHSLKHRY